MKSECVSRKYRPYQFYAVLAAVLIGFFVIFAELASYFILVILQQNFYLPLALRDQQQIEGKTQADTLLSSNEFSRELGWEPRSDNPHGYRGPEKDVATAAIALFGDSFTLGYHPIEKSWPHLLETQLGRPVLNFGVGGYGVDQAYWRFKKRYGGDIHTPYVALNIMSENIARNLSLYRGFYNRRSSLAATKPRFKVLDDERIAYINNPLNSRKELTKLSDIQFLRSIGEEDYWYKHFDEHGLNEMVKFPYIYYLLKALPYYISRFYEHRIKETAPYKDLYLNKDATKILNFIIEQFIKDAKEYGSFPIIMFMPNWMDMDDVVHKHEKTAYADFMARVKAKHPATFDAMAYFLPYLSRGEPISAFFQSRVNGHYNARGDKVLSEGFYLDLMALDQKHALLAAEIRSGDRQRASQSGVPVTSP